MSADAAPKNLDVISNWLARERLWAHHAEGTIRLLAELPTEDTELSLLLSTQSNIHARAVYYLAMARDLHRQIQSVLAKEEARARKEYVNRVLPSRTGSGPGGRPTAAEVEDVLIQSETIAMLRQDCHTAKVIEEVWENILDLVRGRRQLIVQMARIHEKEISQEA